MGGAGSVVDVDARTGAQVHGYHRYLCLYIVSVLVLGSLIQKRSTDKTGCRLTPLCTFLSGPPPEAKEATQKRVEEPDQTLDKRPWGV